VEALGIKHRKLLQCVGGRELLEIAEALHDKGFTERDVKFLRKMIGEVACATVQEPGQARLVEKQFGVIAPLQELEGIIGRERREEGHPRKKERLKFLFALKDMLEPCACGIDERKREGEPLKLRYALLGRDTVNIQGAKSRQSSRRTRSG